MAGLELRSLLLAGIYDTFLRRFETRGLATWRQELLAEVRGVVLEIGAGTGLNLPHYPLALQQLVLAEPDSFMRRRLKRKLAALGRPGVRIDPSPAEYLDLPDASCDYVVSTLVLCTVVEPLACLAEIVRVLRPGGRLLFLEHVLNEDQPTIARWQRRLTPWWRRCSGNCHLDRQTGLALGAAGLQVETLQRAPFPGGPALAGPVIRGSAWKPTAS